MAKRARETVPLQRSRVEGRRGACRLIQCRTMQLPAGMNLQSTPGSALEDGADWAGDSG